MFADPGFGSEAWWWDGEVVYKGAERRSMLTQYTEHHSLPQSQNRYQHDNMKFSTSLAIAAAASSASAHTIFLSVNNGAVGDGVRVPSYDGVRPLALPRPSS
jgi:hypothetical protein